jgi:pimeloyl-ACP methyl ester carboxylesterase/predicted glycosyltransferase
MSGERDHNGVRSEQRQAREPDASGVAEHGGVPLHYDVYGDAPTTVLLMPAWSIVHSRMWKAQVPFLARHYRVITFDGRGSGRSGRPRGPAAYSDATCAGDALAVLDATSTDRAVLVGLSSGAAWSVHVAAAHPDRVLGIFAIAPTCGFAIDHRAKEIANFQSTPEQGHPQGWRKYNREYWLQGGDEDFRRFFFSEMFCEPHSTKQIEDSLRWSAPTDAQTLIDTTAARLGAESLDDVAAKVQCPVHVVHGTDDRVSNRAIGERLAELTGGSFTLIDGGGHGLMARDPVRINAMIRQFVTTATSAAPKVSRWARAARRPPRVLYMSSPIGLGHARRDIAIANELRSLRPDLQIDWLAQDPVTQVLETAGEHVHPASAHLLAESTHIEAEAGEHDLHAFDAIRRMDEILVANFMLFSHIVDEDTPDLVIADEAWEVDYFLHENPELKRFTLAWLTDFVGWLPMPDGGDAEAELTADYNAEMIEQRERYPRVRDRSIFVGNPADVVTGAFGVNLPDIREWTERNFDFCGYVLGAPWTDGSRDALRRRFAIGPGQRLCVVAIGGTAVGRPLLHRVIEAIPAARALDPGLEFTVVAGPRIDPESLPQTEGARVVGFVPDLADLLSAADVAVVQGGLSTCMELTAAGTPFIYVPLEHHFEQNIHVPHRLAQYGAGRMLRYRDVLDSDSFAAAVIEESSTHRAVKKVETDGASRAAAMLADLV